jgi:hypothetical protein
MKADIFCDSLDNKMHAICRLEVAVASKTSKEAGGDNATSLTYPASPLASINSAQQ